MYNPSTCILHFHNGLFDHLGLCSCSLCYYTMLLQFFSIYTLSIATIVHYLIRIEWLSILVSHRNQSKSKLQVSTSGLRPLKFLFLMKQCKLILNGRVLCIRNNHFPMHVGPTKICSAFLTNTYNKYMSLLFIKADEIDIWSLRLWRFTLYLLVYISGQ